MGSQPCNNQGCSRPEIHFSRPGAAEAAEEGPDAAVPLEAHGEPAAPGAGDAVAITIGELQPGVIRSEGSAERRSPFGGSVLDAEVARSAEATAQDSAGGSDAACGPTGPAASLASAPSAPPRRARSRNLSPPTLRVAAGEGSPLGRLQRHVSRRWEELEPEKQNALRLYAITEESLPLQKVLVKYDSRWHWRMRAGCVLILVTLMSAFTAHSVYKVARGRAYTEIHREEKAWYGEAPLPQVAIANVRLRRNFTVRVEHVKINDGNYSTRSATVVPTKPCDVAIGGGAKRRHFENAECLPAGLMIQGIFGDAIYEYVAIDVLYPTASSVADGSISLVIADKPTAYSDVLFSHYYTFTTDVWTGVEVFFKKIVALSGEPLGMFGHTGNDELEDMLESTVYLTYSHEYTRFSTASEYLHVEANERARVFTFYLRASLRESEEFYEVYSVIKLLEKAGGLWISLGLLFSLALWLVFCVHRKFMKCFCPKRDEFPIPLRELRLPRGASTTSAASEKSEDVFTGSQ
eukprot:TRINITY_DN1001_c1_g1_i1.p1 TRINITY_DN1001_c1_g1~~TRINITY_DN1001_c1_g1_i1.p1  ORF type:complete len:521 (+),score=96.83 TRINITY_DN1001_c1_g1_i1:107-1669(+)